MTAIYFKSKGILGYFWWATVNVLVGMVLRLSFLKVKVVDLCFFWCGLIMLLIAAALIIILSWKSCDWLKHLCVFVFYDLYIRLAVVVGWCFRRRTRRYCCHFVNSNLVFPRTLFKSTTMIRYLILVKMLLIGHFGCPINIFSSEIIIWCESLLFKKLVTQIPWFFEETALSWGPLSSTFILLVLVVKTGINIIILERLLIDPPRVHFGVTLCLILVIIRWCGWMVTRIPLLVKMIAGGGFCASQTALSLFCYESVQFVEVVVRLIAWFPCILGLFRCHFEHFIRLCTEVHFACFD